MNDYLLSVVLGIVEGLTEFLPVSSTAHLRIVQALLSVSLTDGYWKMFAIVIQLGAILSLPIYFRARIAAFLATFPGGGARAAAPGPGAAPANRGILAHPLVLTLVAFIVTAVPSYLLTGVIGKHLESIEVMAWSLLVGGVVMWGVDALNASGEAAGPRATTRVRTWAMEDMSLAQAVWIGACQVAAAVFPGTSRSMATIAAGQLAGMSRSAALEFSFFLSIPTMIVATGYDLLKSVLGKGENPVGVSQIDAHGWVLLAIGLMVSFAVAYASVAWFMAYVRRRGFTPFAIYRIVFGILLLVFASRLGG